MPSWRVVPPFIGGHRWSREIGLDLEDLLPDIILGKNSVLREPTYHIDVFGWLIYGYRATIYGYRRLRHRRRSSPAPPTTFRNCHQGRFWNSFTPLNTQIHTKTPGSRSRRQRGIQNIFFPQPGDLAALRLDSQAPFPNLRGATFNMSLLPNASPPGGTDQSNSPAVNLNEADQGGANTSTGLAKSNYDGQTRLMVVSFGGLSSSQGRKASWNSMANLMHTQPDPCYNLFGRKLWRNEHPMKKRDRCRLSTKDTSETQLAMELVLCDRNGWKWIGVRLVPLFWRRQSWYRYKVYAVVCEWGSGCFDWKRWT